MTAAAQGYAFTKHPPINEADCARWLDKEPEPTRFVIGSYAPQGCVTLLIAEGSAGKSILMQTACTCVMTGSRFLGQNVTAGTTAGVFAEDDDNELHVRQVRINRVLDVDMEALIGRVFIQSYAGTDALLWRDHAPTEFAVDLENQLSQIPELRLVVLDNVALLYAGDENSRIEVTGFINHLNGMARRLKVAIILSTHTSKSSDGSFNRASSGSTAWRNACRSAIELTIGDDERPPQLRHNKANYCAKLDTLDLKWRDGVLMADLPDIGFVASLGKSTVERAFLEGLRTLTSRGMDLSHKKAASCYAPREIIKLVIGRKFKVKDLERAMSALIVADEIVIEKYGQRSRGWTRLVVASGKGQEDDLDC